MPESDPEPDSRSLPGRNPVDRFPSRGPVRVLVVIPDPELRTRAEAALGGETQVIAVPDASLALASAFPAAADVILADVAVGEDVMRALRADRRTRGIPLLVLTTRTEPGGVTLSPIDVWVSVTDESFAHPVPGATVNVPLGGLSSGSLAVTTVVEMSDPAALETVRLTVYVPGLSKVWEGFELVAVDPSPKSHCHFDGELVEVSLKLTFSGALPEVGVAVNDAVGGADGPDPTAKISSSISPL